MVESEALFLIPSWTQVSSSALLETFLVKEEIEEEEEGMGYVEGEMRWWVAIGNYFVESLGTSVLPSELTTTPSFCPCKRSEVHVQRLTTAHKIAIFNKACIVTNQEHFSVVEVTSYSLFQPHIQINPLPSLQH